MEQAHHCETVPLTADEKSMLLSIYESRLRYLFIVYIFLVLMGLWPSILDMFNYQYSFITWVEEVITGYGLVELAIIGTGFYFLNSRILPFRRDLISGVKEKISYTIVRKEYFPLTNQYYVAFDDPDYMHHEIDEETYNNCNEGEPMYLYRAIKSKYVFELNGRFSIV